MGAVYTQLSLQERRKIEGWWHAKVPVSEMARALKRHKSTIFREIKRNFWADPPTLNANRSRGSGIAHTPPITQEIPQ